MNPYSLTHLADPQLRRDLHASHWDEYRATARSLAHLAEFDARKLYRPQAYESMYAYCLGELKMSEDMASKRLHAARAASRFPALFDAIAQGRLTVTAVVWLAP